MTYCMEPHVHETASRIAKRLSPLSVILFGSRARGDAHAQSDVDMVVMMPEGTDVHRATLEAMGVARDSPVDVDIVVYTPEQFAKLSVLPGTLPRRAIKEGILLHGDLDSNARELLRLAEEDLDVARRMSADTRSDIRARAFHSQQAAEKALKAALRASNQDYNPTHSLKKLATELPHNWGVSYTDFEWDRLTKFAITARYGEGNGGSIPDKNDADWAFNMATGIVNGIGAGIERDMAL